MSDDYTTGVLRKFDLAIKRERVTDLQRNPYEIAKTAAKWVECDPLSREMQELTDRHVLAYNKQNRAGAFIFGDTYKGMPATDALKIIAGQDFTKGQRYDAGYQVFQHEYLNISLVCITDETQELLTIVFDFDIYIGTNKIDPESLGGLGIMEAKIVKDRFIGQIDATGGLQTKLYILRSWSVLEEATA